MRVLWATRDDMAGRYGDVLGVWRPWAAGRLDGSPVDSGHHMAEEAPEAVVSALLAFWGAETPERTAAQQPARKRC
ncbi:hypothetical protein SCANM63S_07810 [Streptomyces canarius]